MTKRVVITAMGVVSPLGEDAQGIALGFKTGRVAFRRAEGDSQWVVCPVADFDVRRYTGRHKNLRYLNRGAQLAAAAAVSTLEKARLADAVLDIGVELLLDEVHSGQRGPQDGEDEHGE